MDTTAITQIAAHAQVLACHIREYSERRIKERIETERQTIDIEVEKKVEAKIAQTLSVEIQKSTDLRWIEQERAVLKKETLDYYKSFLFWTGVQLSKTIPALLIMVLCGLIGGGFGVIVGLNVLPSAVACSSVSSWCYFLRANKETTVAPEIPAAGKKDTQIRPVNKRKMRK